MDSFIFRFSGFFKKWGVPTCEFSLSKFPSFKFLGWQTLSFQMSGSKLGVIRRHLADSRDMSNCHTGGEKILASSE